MKKVLLWLIVLIFFAVASSALWLKFRTERAPQQYEDPGIPADLEIPEDIPIE